ncbi:TetR/AcrR family transcriptional regulator [Paractinoplanes brasiliensis]|uniref:TetR family transcriptional regulator n=1 Tax=Paractinoplanes brasiliensis TaxID=52695 RepID=A0A4R6JN27_9ACTN|nr:TetR/AcrR family transcriptional regulator [Actinoplanes brasiliensis]TDO37287.1 TetR family transcriptional regulator [Actinoplanes brasiliensis]GID29399.1 TetR family transcriptional regulator [Actinoplanes brasiliensis]
MRRDAARNQELILRSAHEVFSELGTDVGLDVVAGRAGVGVGTVYRHFPNKDLLLDHLVNTMYEGLIAAAQEALARGDGTGLEDFLRRLSRSLIEHLGYSDRFISGRGPGVGEQLDSLFDQLLAQAKTHRMINDSTTKADLQMLIWGVRGVVAVSGPVAPDAWERFLDIHLAGLRATPFPSAKPGPDARQIRDMLDARDKN